MLPPGDTRSRRRGLTPLVCAAVSSASSGKRHGWHSEPFLRRAVGMNCRAPRVVVEECRAKRGGPDDISKRPFGDDTPKTVRRTVSGSLGEVRVPTNHVTNAGVCTVVEPRLACQYTSNAVAGVANRAIRHRAELVDWVGRKVGRESGCVELARDDPRSHQPSSGCVSRATGDNRPGGQTGHERQSVSQSHAIHHRRGSGVPPTGFV